MRIFGAGLLWLFLGCGNATSALETQTISPESAMFMITMPANPTTGYQLTVQKYDTDLFKLVESHYQSSKPALMGSGGKMVFKFELLEGHVYPKNTQMVFRSARPWEKGDGILTPVDIYFEMKK